MSVVNHLSRFDFDKMDLWREFSLYLCPELGDTKGSRGDLISDDQGTTVVSRFGIGELQVHAISNDKRINCTYHVEQIFYVFKNVMKLALRQGDTKGKVLLFPSPNDQVSLTGWVSSFATTSDEKIIPFLVVPKYRDLPFFNLNSCPVQVWQLLQPRLQAFLHSAYGIHWTEKEDSPLARRCLETWEGNTSAFRIQDVCRAARRTVIYPTHTERQRNRIPEITLSWKPWVVQAFPEHPFPQLAAPDASTPPPYAAYLLQNCEEQDAQRRFTNITITSNDDKTFYAHDFVLIPSSPPLAALLNSAMKEGVSKQIKLESDGKTVKAFLTFLYDRQDPFSNENPQEIDAQELLELASLFTIDALVACCAHHIIANTEEDQWELIGELGALYDSKDLLQAYDCYRIRQGKPLPFLMKAVFAKHGLFVPPPSIEVCVAADVSNLGLHCEPLWTDEPPTPLMLTDRGWVGRVPAGKEFKFVQIGEGNSVKWEIRNWNRKMEEQVPTPVQPEPTAVYFAAGQVRF